MTSKGTNPLPQADAVKPEPPPGPPPRTELSCDKCGTVLTTEKEAYWHQRKDSAGCVHTLMGMVIDLNERLERIERVFVAAATPKPDETAAAATEATPA